MHAETLLLGRYRHLRELGRGAGGRVIEVVDEGSDSHPHRAIKSVAPADWAQLRLEREMLSAASHPHLVGVHELLRLDAAVPPPFGLPRGTALLVEDLAPGVDGAQAFLGLAPASRREQALRAAHQVAGALGALHAVGLVHGDVKPANVRVDEVRGATLVDLGLAGPASGGGPVRGTLPFLAPEALAGVRSPGTDLYALGITLHRWLGGTLPSPGAPRPPRPDEGAEVARLLGALTARAAEERLTTAREAVGAIADAAARLGFELPRTVLAPAPRERAAAVRVLPFVEARPGLVEALAEAIAAGGVVEVVGPPGAGRTRAIREAVARLQAVAGERGEPPRTFLTVTGAEPPSGPAILHVVGAAPAERWVREARLAGAERTVVVERSGEGGSVRVEPLPEAPFRALVAEVLGADPSATVVRAAREASGGLAGRLVRLVGEVLAEGDDPAAPDVLLARSRRGSELLESAAHEAASRLALLGGSAPVAALEAVSAGVAELVREGDAVLTRDGRVTLRADHRGRLMVEGTAKRRAARARGLEAFDPASAAYLAAHRGEGDPAGFVAVARAARDEGRAADAERILDDALRLLGDDVGLRRALFELRLSLARYERAAEVAPTAGERAEALRRGGRPEEARRALSDAPEDAAPGTRGWLALGEGDVDAAASFAERAEPAVGAELRAWLTLARGDGAAARRAVEGALAAGAAPGATARLRSTLGAALHQAGELREARDAHARSLEAARRLGERHLEASALGNLGAVELELGNLGPALEALRDAARRLVMLGRERDVVRALANLASAALVLGDRSAAEGWVAEARRSLGEADDVARAHLAGLAADIALRDGDLGAARRAAREALEVPGAAARWEPRLVALLARHDRRWADRWTPAFDGFEPTLATLRAALARGELPAAREALARLEPRSWAEALERAFAALEIADADGDEPTQRQAAAEARALLDAGARTLEPEQRARLRSSARHQRVAVAGAAAPVDRSAERWRRVGALAKRLGQEESPDAIEGTLVRSALDLVDAERALLVARTETGELAVRARAGMGADDGLSRSVVARALATRAPVVSMDALADEELDSAASVHALALRSVLCVPLRGRAAVLYLDDRLRTGVFGDDDRRLVRDLADLGSLALEAAERRARESEVRERLARAKHELEVRVRDQERELAALRPADGELVAVSPAMRAVIDLARRAAASDVPLLVTGESGTGKELLARAVHRWSGRASGPFVAESCASLPESLVESLLFGHERGAFTGALEARPGLFRAAHGGTLFLDEIGEMSPGIQAKILRVLQEGEVRPVGATRSLPVDVRLVSATHRPLQDWVAAGRFREDLYYRIAVVRLEVPPLRERPADIPDLVRRFVRRNGAESGPMRVTDEALALLAAHSWPGNVRELENEIRRACALGATTLDRDALSPGLRGASDDPLDLKAQVAALESRLIGEALARTEGNRTQAAELLGVSRYGLQKMIKRLGLE